MSKAERLAQNQANGNAARDATAARYPDSRIEVTLDTQQRARRIDVLTPDGTAIESKVGKISATDDIKTQVLKDVELRENTSVNNPVHSVQWEFSRSPVTGKLGTTPALAQFLRDHGIDPVIKD